MKRKSLISDVLIRVNDLEKHCLSNGLGLHEVFCDSNDALNHYLNRPINKAEYYKAKSSRKFVFNGSY